MQRGSRSSGGVNICSTAPVAFQGQDQRDSHEGSPNHLVFFLDTILEVSDPLDTSDDGHQHERLLACIDDAEHMAVTGAKDPYPMTTPLRHSVPLLEAFWRTLTANSSDPSGNHSVQDWPYGYLRCKHALSRSCGVPTTSILTDVQQYQDRHTDSIASQVATFKECVDTLLAASTSRSFCVTTSGLLGLVPATAQPSDSICLQPGKEVPLVMRPRIGRQSQPELELVGEAYFHGVAARAAVEAFQRAGKEPSSVVLV